MSTKNKNIVRINGGGALIAIFKYVLHNAFSLQTNTVIHTQNLYQFKHPME